MKKSILIFLFLIFCLPLKAQNVELGFRLETQGLNKKYTGGNTDFVFIPLPSCLQLNLAVYPLKNFSLEARFGREFLFEEYTGFEYGLFSKYFLTDHFYFTGGVAGHSNEGGKGGISSGNTMNSLIMPAFGLGTRQWDFISFELLVQHADNKAIGWARQYGIDGQIVASKTKVDWILKLGLVFGWKL